MKKFFKIATTLCLAFCLFVGGALVLNGCNKETELNYGTVTRDPSQTGGASLTFVYDKDTHTAIFGGEGQQVAYYDIDTTVGRNEAGNRVGIQITAPEEVTDLSKSTLTYNGTTYENGSFLDGDNYVWFYPLFTENIRTRTVKIRWQPNTKEQTYTVKLADGTTFASATSINPTNYDVRLNNNQNNYAQNNSMNNYNGRSYNGYNRNVNRIRNNYNRNTNPTDVDSNSNGNNGLVNNGTNNGVTYNGARTMPRVSNGYYR